MYHFVSGQIVDIQNRRIYPGKVVIRESRIEAIEPISEADAGPGYIMPGFVDAHVHIESSLMPPSSFARVALGHGTVATVSDPHEIANVLGVDGVDYMIDNSRLVPLKFFFGAPSCVPATPFETAGAELDADAVKSLLEREEIKYLSEMMNWPGVLQDDPEVLRKIRHARNLNKPVDGHAPGLRGDEASKYAAAGISTDHESFALEEAEDKLKAGMKILIREGSAARNFEALFPLIDQYPDQVMLCTDDLHPDLFLKGHINKLVARALRQGAELFNVLQAACLNPVAHYGLPVGTLQVGDPADFIQVNDLQEFDVARSFIEGEMVSESQIPQFTGHKPLLKNFFEPQTFSPEDFHIPARQGRFLAITAENHQLVTGTEWVNPYIKDKRVEPDTQQDILLLAVVNRYRKSNPAVSLVKNFGLKKGALASSVAHDSHNVLAVGTSYEDLCRAVNLVMQNRGGLAVAKSDYTDYLSLPIAGLMSDLSPEQIAEKYISLDHQAKQLGSTLDAPFMTLAFMALLVIPDLKLSDKGLFSGKNFRFVDPWE